MIHTWAWGITLILVGLLQFGVTFQYMGWAIGAALVVAGVAYIAGK